MMGAYQGKITPVSHMLAEARAAGPLTQSALHNDGQPVAVTRDAATAATLCRDLHNRGDSRTDAWRFGILQTLDYYTTYTAIAGPGLGAQVFNQEPPPTGWNCVDAAFAALADHLARRDGWTPPTWTSDPTRIARPPWYVAPIAQKPGYFRDEADQATPPDFTRHGVYICRNDLERA